MPLLAPELQRWVNRPYLFWGERRGLVQITLLLAATTFLVTLAAMVVLPASWLRDWWGTFPGLVSLSCVPLAVAFRRALVALDEGGMLGELALTSLDRAAFAQAVLRRLLMPGYAILVALFLATAALALVGALLVDGAIDARHLERTIATLASAAATLLVAWHMAIALLRLWDFVGETISNVRTYMGRFHRLVLLPLFLLCLPLFGGMLMLSMMSVGLIATLGLGVAAWRGDGAWGWLPAVREHPFFAPLREDEF